MFGPPTCLVILSFARHGFAYAGLAASTVLNRHFQTMYVEIWSWGDNVIDVCPRDGVMLGPLPRHHVLRPWPQIGFAVQTWRLQRSNWLVVWLIS